MNSNEQNNTKLIRIAEADFQAMEDLRLAFIKKNNLIINKKDFFAAIIHWLSTNFDEWTRPEHGQKNTLNKNEEV